MSVPRVDQWRPLPGQSVGRPPGFNRWAVGDWLNRELRGAWGEAATRPLEKPRPQHVGAGFSPQMSFSACVGSGGAPSSLGAGAPSPLGAPAPVDPVELVVSEFLGPLGASTCGWGSFPRGLGSGVSTTGGGATGSGAGSPSCSHLARTRFSSSSRRLFRDVRTAGTPSRGSPRTRRSTR